MVFDCTYDLFNPEIGLQQFDGSHIPGAIYVKLDTHLSVKDDPSAVSGGRHPLPSRENFAAWLSSIGFTNSHQAIVYDRCWRAKRRNFLDWAKGGVRQIRQKGRL